MPFITSDPNTRPPATLQKEEAPTPVLTSIFYILGGLQILLAIGAAVIAKDGISIAIILGAGALPLIGLGQAIGYLGQTAYYARLTYEKIKRQP